MLYTRICMYTANIGYAPYMHSSYIGLNIGDLALYLAYTGNIGYLALYSPYVPYIPYLGYIRYIRYIGCICLYTALGRI